MRIRIITDSTADVLPHIRKQLHTVPLTVHFGSQEYIDGVTITHKEFYEKLVETDELPSTSQASPAAFEQFFDEQDTSDHAIVITVSSKLSGTYQSAMIAAAGRTNVHVIDSESVAIGSGILAELALRLVNRGLPVDTIVKQLEVEKKNIRLIALLDTLEYLKRGGRISKTAAFAGGVLNIKPVVSLVNGEIQMLGKARGSRQGNNLLVEEIEKAGGVDFSKPLLLGYTGMSDILLKKYITDSNRLWKDAAEELYYTPIGSVIGTHAGPGAIAVAFFKQE